MKNVIFSTEDMWRQYRSSFVDGDHLKKYVVEPWNFICHNYKEYGQYWNFYNPKSTVWPVLQQGLNLKVFKAFGSNALVYNPSEIRTKLDCTPERGFLVGLAEGLLCYKIYCAATKSSIRALDVTFISESDGKLFVNYMPHYDAPAHQRQPSKKHIFMVRRKCRSYRKVQWRPGPINFQL